MVTGKVVYFASMDRIYFSFLFFVREENGLKALEDSDHSCGKCDNNEMRVHVVLQIFLITFKF